ncbi:hypothetical protein C8R43DRAFT_967232 [Mycena crocata]|nr:hypothetical protein C8R43DRAFT_967232 [Mycena crocata]
MPSNAQFLQETDIVTAINKFSNDAFVLKRDVEDTKIQLSTVMPGTLFEPYDILVEFIKSEQTIATTVHTKVIQNLSSNVVDAAEDTSCPVPEKAEEAQAYLTVLGKTDFSVGSDKKSAAFSAAIQTVSQMLDSHIAELNGKADDDSKLVPLNKELAGLKGKKSAAETKLTGIGSLLNKKVISEVISTGSATYDEQVKSGKVPGKNPLESVIGKAKKFGDKLPDAPDDDATAREIETLSAQIVKLQEKIHVLQAEQQKASQTAEEETALKETLNKYGERFKGVAKNLDKLQEVPKAAQNYVQEWQKFLGTTAARDTFQLKEHTNLLKSRSQMLSPIDEALTRFCSRTI